MKTNPEWICGEWDRIGSGPGQTGQTTVLAGTPRLTKLPGQETGCSDAGLYYLNQVLAGGDQFSPSIS